MKKRCCRILSCFSFLLFIALSLNCLISNAKTKSANQGAVKWQGKGFTIKDDVLQARGGQVIGYSGNKSWTSCKIKFVVKNLNENPKAYFLIRPRYALGRKFYQVWFVGSEVRIGYRLRKKYKPMMTRVKYKLPLDKNTTIEINISGYKIVVKANNKIIATYEDSEKLIQKGNVMFFFNKYSADISKILVTSNSKGGFNVSNADVDDDWADTLKAIQKSEAKYKKYLYLDAVMDLQLRTECLIDYYKKWNVKLDKSGLETIIKTCIAARLSFKDRSQDQYYNEVIAIYKKYYPVYKNKYEKLYKVFKQRPAVEITDEYKNNLKNVRMGYIRVKRKNYSKEEIDRIVFKQALVNGLNFIKIDNMRQIMSDNYNPAIRNLWNWPVNYRKAKMFVDAIHKLGMLANIHLTTAFVHPEFIKKHPEWEMFSARTGARYTNKRYKNPGVVCINNPEFRAQYRKNLSKLFTESGFDSINIDEIQFFNRDFCGCKYCRKKFKAKYGLEIPPADDKAFWQDRDARYQKWVDFKINSINDFYEDVVFKAAKNAYMLTYHSMPPATYGSQHSNASYEKQASYARMNGNELHGMSSKQPWLFYYNWKDYWVQSQYVQAVSRKYDNLSWALPQDALLPCKGLKRRPYEDNFPAKGHPLGEDFFMWAMLKAINSNVWFHANNRIAIQFERKYKKLFDATPRETYIPGSVGIYYSEAMKMTYHQKESFWHRIYYWEMRAWGELCTKENIPFDVLLEKSLSYENLKKYSLLIFPNSGYLSKQDVASIKKYIKNGGTVVATYETSHYNEKGSKLKNFQLSDLMGVSSAKSYVTEYKGKINYNSALIKKIISINKEILPPTDFNGYILHITPVAKLADKGIKVLATFANSMPAIIYRKYGKGNFYYMSAKLSLETIRTPEISTKDAYVLPDKSITALFTDIVKKYGMLNPPWLISGFPKGVFVNVLNNPNGGYTCHVINASDNDTLQMGQKFARKYINYPAMPKGINGTITINKPKGKISQAYLISPDFPGKYKISFKQDKNKLQVVIPCDKLFRYMIVVLE